jgi:fructokinase
MFLVCGEALFDIFVDGSVDPSSTQLSLDAVAGGSPFNVAIGLARLSQPSALLTGVSQDFLGQRLMAVLTSEGVNTDFVASKALPTTLSFIQKDEHGVPDYAFYGNGAADRSVSIEDLPESAEFSGIHVGSYSIATPPTSDSLLTLIEKHSGKCLISLDPNVRLGVEPNKDIWRERVALIAKHANLLKISDEDFEHLYPETTFEDKAKEWLSLGINLVVLTKGGDGAQLWSQSSTASVKTPKITVADTVGAGDTFQTALIDQLLTMREASAGWSAQLTEDKLKAIGEFAAAAAAITCSRQGADLPNRDEITAAMQSAG